MSTIQLTSEDLPRWMPLIIDSGLGASIGIQNIPAEARERALNVVAEYAGSLCGRCQLNIRQAPAERPYELGSPGGDFRRRGQGDDRV